MNKNIIRFTQVLMFVAAMPISEGWATDAENKQAEKISYYISSVAKTVGGSKKIGVNSVTMNWSENPEVKVVTTFPPNKRVAAIMTLIDFEKENEEKAFPNILKNPEQLAASLITRLLALSKLVSLTKATGNDVVIKDYLDGEIADLKLIFEGKVQYGIYLQSRKMREEKYLMILGQDKDLLTEYFTFRMAKDSITQVLANKTTLVALFEACMQNTNMCEKLSAN